MVDSRTERFIDALHALEDEGDVDRIVSLFADNAELHNPTERYVHRGAEGARKFWDSYRRSFDAIHSEFRAVGEADDAALLEWESRGRTSDGGPIRYGGVSVIEFDGERIRRFRSYFDAHALGEQFERSHGPGD